ncbi:MAG: DUF6929 family protein [Myxococcaceae bacterium]
MQLEALRTLTFSDKLPDAPPHLAAASGLVVLGELLCVVADDDLHLGLFPRDPRLPGKVCRMLPGRLPEEHSARKAAKPDFEVLVRLPPFVGYDDGALLALGSGSTARRARGVLLALSHVETFTPGLTELVDFTPVYSALKLPELNIEGAVVLGDELVLVQRGNGKLGQNALVRLDLRKVTDALGQGELLDASAVRGVRPVRLDDGLGFTDAQALPDGRLIFSAVAEASDSTYEDGPCTRAVLGVMESSGNMLRAEALEPCAKIEGISFGTNELLLVADADDARQPAMLFRISGENLRSLLAAG